LANVLFFGPKVPTLGRRLFGFLIRPGADKGRQALELAKLKKKAEKREKKKVCWCLQSTHHYDIKIWVFMNSNPKPGERHEEIGSCLIYPYPPNRTSLD